MPEQASALRRINHWKASTCRETRGGRRYNRVFIGALSALLSPSFEACRRRISGRRTLAVKGQHHTRAGLRSYVDHSIVNQVRPVVTLNRRVARCHRMSLTALTFIAKRLVPKSFHCSQQCTVPGL